ncbi:hypothetical protein C8Q77DRAFT_1120652 [Trametes polyzona]|nr:hypothetical protein C8Q77DRAFT_1120652 [Trametes polyzona]
MNIRGTSGRCPESPKKSMCSARLMGHGHKTQPKKRRDPWGGKLLARHIMPAPVAAPRPR